MAQILKAAPLVERTLEQLKKDCAELVQKGVVPRMEVLLVGEHKPSRIYTSNKKKFCESFGAECIIHKLDEKISEAEFLKRLSAITQKDDVHGCFVQLPLPKHLQHIKLEELIPKHKDVDGFHPSNLYGLMTHTPNTLKPCTPLGIMQLLKHYQIDIAGANVVIVGRSLIVGRPLSLMMTSANATVTLCHSKTRDIREHTKRADIIVSAVGKARYLDDSYLNPNAQQVLVDVGINHDSSGKLCGDLDISSIEYKVKAYTPVPGGVGPLTILSLSQNLLQAAKNLI